MRMTGMMSLVAIGLLIGCAAQEEAGEPGPPDTQEAQRESHAQTEGGEPEGGEPEGGEAEGGEPEGSEPEEGEAEEGHDGQASPVPSSLEHPLEFEALGMEGYRRLELTPDGRGEWQLNMLEPGTFTLGDDQLAEVAAALHAADLPSLPAELRGDEPDYDDDEVFRFVHGEVELEAEWRYAPQEIRDLGDLLLDIFRTHAANRS